MAKHFGNCRICGVVGPLTFEHVPPKSAGNEPYGIAFDVAHHMQNTVDSPISEMRRRKLPRGSGGHYFCARCNNWTGGMYGPAYAMWAHQGQRHRLALGDTNSIALPFRIFPLRVFKQILAIFGATCGERMFEVHPFLRKLVLDRDAHGMPDDLRLYCYIVHPYSRFSRHSGIVGIADIGSGKAHTLAEFAFRPFGYLLTFGSTPPPERGLFDLTFFSNHSFGDYRELHLPIPVRPVESYLPADFRSKAEWLSATGGYSVGSEPG